MGGTSALRSRAVVAVLVLGVVAGCACISMMARGSVQRFELAQQRAADMDLAAGSSGEGVKLQKEIDMARILWTKGEAEQEGGEKDIRNARSVATNSPN